MSINPYQPPAGEGIGASAAVADEVSPTILELLRRARPWISFVAWCGVVMGVLSLLAMFADDIDTSETLVLLVGGAVQIGFSLLLRRYAKAISQVSRSGRLADLEQAIAAQTTFWLALGIMAMLSVALLGGLFVLAVVLGIMAS